MTELRDAIRVVGGPWPERIGATGHICHPTAEEARVYPFHGLGRDEVVVFLDDDPLRGGGEGWSFVLRRRNIEVL